MFGYETGGMAWKEEVSVGGHRALRILEPNPFQIILSLSPYIYVCVCVCVFVLCL